MWSGVISSGQCPVTNCRTLCVSAVESNTCDRAAERVRLFCGESPLTSSCLMGIASRKASGNRPTGRWLTLGVWGRTCWLVFCQREGSQCLAVNKKGAGKIRPNTIIISQRRFQVNGKMPPPGQNLWPAQKQLAAFGKHSVLKSWKFHDIL